MLDCVEKNISLFESVLPADAHAHKTRFFRAEKLVAQRRAMQSASYGDSVLLAQNIAYFVAGAVSDSETDYAAGIFRLMICTSGISFKPSFTVFATSSICA